MSTTEKKRALWVPRHPEETNAARFMRYVNKRHSIQLKTYHDLHRWSVAADSLQHFWRDAYSFLELAPPGTKQIGNMLESEVGIDFSHTKNPPKKEKKNKKEHEVVLCSQFQAVD